MSDDFQRDPFAPPSEGAEENPSPQVDVFAEEETPMGSGYETLYEEPEPFVMDEEEVPESPEAEQPSGKRWWLVAAVIVVMLLGWLGARSWRSRQAPASEVRPQAPLSLPQPTVTATPEVPALVVQPQPAVTATATTAPPSAPASASGIKIGVRVRVENTDGAGIRYRSGPGLNYLTYDILPDGTVLEVIEGPEENDGLQWWRLRAKDGLVGWAAERYLKPVIGNQ